MPILNLSKIHYCRCNVREDTTFLTIVVCKQQLKEHAADCKYKCVTRLQPITRQTQDTRSYLMYHLVLLHNTWCCQILYLSDQRLIATDTVTTSTQKMVSHLTIHGNDYYSQSQNSIDICRSHALLDIAVTSVCLMPCITPL